MWSERGPLRYERLTWPEVRRAAAEDRVALVPVATLDKGHQLLATAVAECVAAVDELLVKPLPRRRSPAAEGGEAESPG